MGCIKEADSSDYQATDETNAQDAQANQDASGDPVNMVTGAFTFAEYDLRIPTQRLIIDLTRHYNNQLHDSSPQAVISGFGRGWNHSLSLHLEPGPGPAQISYVDDLGTRIIFGVVFEQFEVACGLCRLKLEEDGFRVTQSGKTLATFTRDGEFIPPEKDQSDESLGEAEAKVVPQIAMGPGFFQIIYTDIDSQSLLFNLPDHGCGFIPPAGSLALALKRRDDGTFCLRQIDGLEAWFSATGKLTRLVRPGPRADSQITLSYDSNDRLIAADGENGRGIKFEYQGESPLIRRVRDHTERCLQYFYNDQQELVEVHDPANRVRRYGYLEWTGTVATGKGKSVKAVIRALNKIYPFVEKGKPPAAKPVLTNQYTSDRRVARQKDILGHVTRFDYNRFTYTTYLTDPDGWTTVYAFNSNGNTTKVRKPCGGTKEYIYDQRSNLLAEIDEAGYTTYYAKLKDPQRFDRQKEFGLRANGNRSTYVTPSDDEIEIGYDAFGNRPLMRDSLGNETRFWDYNEFGRPRRVDLPDGSSVYYTYDERSGLPLRSEKVITIGRVVPVTKVEVWQYDDFGNLTRFEEYALDAQYLCEPKRVIALEYDGGGNTPRSRKEWIETQEEGFVRGKYEEYTWDTLGRLTKTINFRGSILENPPRQLITQFGYDILGREVWRIDPDGNGICFVRNLRGQVVEGFKVIKPSPETLPAVRSEQRLERRFWTYDVAGQEILYIDETGGKTRHEWDSCGRCIKITDPFDAAITYEYDKDGNQSSKLTSSGHRTTITYDRVGRPIAVRDNLGRSSARSYDPIGRIEAITENKARQATVTKFQYDVLGHLEKVFYPDGSTERYETDELGNVVLHEQGFSEHTKRYVEAYAYDVLGRRISASAGSGDKFFTLFTYKYFDQQLKISIIDALGNQSQIFYDTNGNAVGKVDGDGRIVHYVYDESNRLLNRRSTDGSILSGYSYDGIGRLESAWEKPIQYRWSYDGNGRVTSHEQTIGDFSNKIHYEYDDLGRLSKKYINDDWWMHFDYVPETRWVSRVELPGRSIRYQFDVGGKITEEQWDDSGHSSYQFYPDGSLKDIESFNERGERIFLQQIERDLMGRPAEEVYITPQQKEHLYYYYDQRNQLVRIDREEDGTANPHRQFIFDHLGNRLQEHRNGELFSTYQYDSVNRLLEYCDVGGKKVSYEYDHAGNVIQLGSHKFVYDSDQRLKQVFLNDHQDNSIEYFYSPLGNLVIRSHSTETSPELALYDGYQQITSQSEAGIQYFFWGFQLDNLIAVSSPNRVPKRVYTDRLGSVLSVDPERSWTQYSPFGENICEDEPPVLFGFSGKRFEKETQLYNGRARYYDPWSGRFTQPDPSGILDGLNLYLYAKNNPLIYIDPLGLASSTVDAVRDAQGSIYTVVFEAYLTPGVHYPGLKDTIHFREANRQLHEALTANPSLGRALEGLYPGITRGSAPSSRGFYPAGAPTPELTWHHHPTREGVMQLVPRSEHQAGGSLYHSFHPGGRGGMENWGGGREGGGGEK